MANRTHPVVVATRVTHVERALIDVVAAEERVTVADLLRSIVLPEISRRVAHRAAQMPGMAATETVPPGLGVEL